MDRKLHATDNCTFLGRVAVGAAGLLIDVGCKNGVLVNTTTGRKDGAIVVGVSAGLVGNATKGVDNMDTGLRTGGDAGATTSILIVVGMEGLLSLLLLLSPPPQFPSPQYQYPPIPATTPTKMTIKQPRHPLK